MKIKEWFENAWGMVLILGIMALSILAFVLFLKGSLWLVENLLPWVYAAGWIVLAINILILLPMALFKRLRSVSAGLIRASSFVYGLAMWLTGFAITYVLWGGFAVVIGLAMFGVGVVPMALLASLFKGRMDIVFTIVIMAVLTYGSRLVAWKLDPEMT